jgi:hypothetical protein
MVKSTSWVLASSIAAWGISCLSLDLRNVERKIPRGKAPLSFFCLLELLFDVPSEIVGSKIPLSPWLGNFPNRGRVKVAA